MCDWREARKRERQTGRAGRDRDVQIGKKMKKKEWRKRRREGGKKQGASDKEIQRERNAGNGVGFKKNQGRREITKERQQRTRNGINQVRIRLN